MSAEPREASDSKRSIDTFSQRNCEPFTPLLSRLFQEQLPRVEISSDLPSLPDLLSGTRSFSVFFDSALQDSGSLPYAAASTVGDGLADAEAAAFAALSVLSPEPESEEQPHGDQHHGDGGRADKDAVESLRSLILLVSLCSSLHGSFTHDARGSLRSERGRVVTVRGEAVVWSSFACFAGVREGGVKGPQSLSESASWEASFWALSCNSLLSGTTPTVAALFGVLDGHDDIRRAERHSHRPLLGRRTGAAQLVVDEGLVPEILQHAGLEFGRGRGGEEVAVGVGEPLGATEEPPAGVLPAAGDSVAADSVAVGSGRWAAASLSAKSCSAWLSSLTALS